MKLRYSPTSPYVRKVTVTALETGLHDRIERLPTDIREPRADFLADNPLGKVPTLITDDGLPLFDSRVICEYLDSLHDGHKLFPVDVPARWRTLRLMALADGILDAAVLRRMETLRPEKEQSAAWIERQKAKVTRGLDMLEREVPRFHPAGHHRPDHRRLLPRLARLPLRHRRRLADRPAAARRLVQHVHDPAVDGRDGAGRGLGCTC